MIGLLDTLNEWGFALSQVLKGQLETGSFLALFVVFAAGVLTSFTPCVYPMIPVTVSYMGGAAAGNRRRAVALSLVYVGGLSTVYAALGLFASLAGKIFGQFTHNPWIYGSVGVLIVVFGLSMLGWIDVPVPGFMAGVQREGAQRGGYLGAALMGVAAGFIAAPCTAPVLGLLLTYVASSNDVVWGTALLFAFALGLSLLLLVLGIFSGMLGTLPQAGRWMDWIKKGFGVLMLVIGAYFLWQAAAMFLVRPPTS